MLALDINNVGVAAAAAAYTIFFDRVWGSPVLVLFDPLLLVLGRLLEVGFTRELASGGIGGAVLNGGVSIAEITEVMDVFWTEEGASRKRMDRSITPL